MLVAHDNKMLNFIHDSDMHYGYYGGTDPRNIKKDHVETILDSDVEFVIVSGDLTDHGTDELEALVDRFVKPLEEGGKEVYLCKGNHDRGPSFFFGLFSHNPVEEYL